MKIKIDSFEKGGLIPEEFTCDGTNLSPEIELEEVSANAKSLVLHMEDKDSPDSPWSHWLMWNIPPITEKISRARKPDGAIEGVTSFGNIGYGGPCPESGEHRYTFRIYALDVTLDLPATSTWKEVDKATMGHVLEYEEYMGRYERNK